jgi:arylsulfatase A-like enzyme
VADEHPNILLVFADQQRAGMLGCEGNHQAITPNLDLFSTRGTLVEHCIANSPVCCPSRGTMWTGTYPTTHRVLSNDLPVRTDLPTLATVCRDAGYRTGYVGKWHLDGVPRSKFTPPGARRLGFDDFWAAYNCSHSYYQAKYYRDTPNLVTDPRYEPTVQTDLAIEFLDTHPVDRPFLLALSWGPPHDPYPQVPEQFRAMFDPATIEPRGNAQPDAVNPLARGLDFRRTYADYYAAVSALDAEFGRLLAHLKARGLSDNTIIVFTSDHGDMLWSHGWMKKQSPYEESIRVPLVIAGPGLPQARTSSTLFGLVDLMPTLLGLAGLPIPATVQGCDRSSKLAATRDQQDVQFIMNHHACDEAAIQGMPEWRGLRTNRYTYVEQTGHQPWLLFDNLVDPLQLHNRIDQDDVLVASLSQQIRQFLAETSDPFLPGDQLLRNYQLQEAWADRERRINL